MWTDHLLRSATVRDEGFILVNKKLMSTVLLFLVFIGFLWWGLAMLFGPHGDPESVVYSLLLLGCAGYALVSLLLLPRKKEP